MIGGKIHHVDPLTSTTRLLHDFNSSSSRMPNPESGDSGAYGSGMTAEALVEDPFTPDIFYTFAGIHGKAGTWAVWKLDLRAFDNEGDAREVAIEKLADVPWAMWMNGATMLPEHHTLLIAESLLGQIISYHIPTGKASIWL
jgi:hypothetical protein